MLVAKSRGGSWCLSVNITVILEVDVVRGVSTGCDKTPACNLQNLFKNPAKSSDLLEFLDVQIRIFMWRKSKSVEDQKKHRKMEMT